MKGRSTVEHHIVSNVVTIALRMIYCLKTLKYDKIEKHMNTAHTIDPLKAMLKLRG